IERGANAFEREIGSLLPRGREVGRDASAPEEQCARLLAEAFDVEARAMREGLRASYGVDASDEAPQPLERVGILELRRSTTAAREDGYAKAPMMGEGFSLECQGRDDRNLGGRELLRKGVLLQDLHIAPAPGTVELRHHRGRVLDPHLVDA